MCKLKLRFACASILLLGIFFAKAQSARIVDLKVSIVSPIKNTYIKSPGTIEVKFSVFNKGTSDLKPTDRLSYYPISADTLFKVKFIYPTKVIHPLDSEISSVFIPFNSPYDQNYYYVGIDGLGAFNNSSDSLRSESLSMQKDNSASVIVKHRSATSSISKQYSNQLIVYPNPIIDFLNIEFEKVYEDMQVSLIDIKGAEIKRLIFNGQLSNVIIDVNELDNGIYFIKCYSKNIIMYKKIFIAG